MGIGIDNDFSQYRDVLNLHGQIIIEDTNVRLEEIERLRKTSNTTYTSPEIGERALLNNKKEFCNGLRNKIRRLDIKNIKKNIKSSLLIFWNDFKFSLKQLSNYKIIVLGMLIMAFSSIFPVFILPICYGNLYNVGSMNLQELEFFSKALGISMKILIVGFITLQIGMLKPLFDKRT